VCAQISDALQALVARDGSAPMAAPVQAPSRADDLSRA
jgi:hypothetical protein